MTGVSLDAIVLLGCRVTDLGEPGPAAARRAARAAGAWAEGLAPVVVASGGRRWGNHAEATVLARALERLGVPTAAVRTELWSFTTTENAIFTARLLARRNGSAPKVGLVTCSWHMARAARDFRTVGCDVVPCPAQAPATLVVRALELGRALLDARAIRRREVFERAAAWCGA